MHGEQINPISLILMLLFAIVILTAFSSGLGVIYEFFYKRFGKVKTKFMFMLMLIILLAFSDAVPVKTFNALMGLFVGSILLIGFIYLIRYWRDKFGR